MTETNTGQVRWWLSTADRTNLLTEQTPLELESEAGSGEVDEFVVQVDPAQRFQEIEGFGASFTDTATWILQNRLTASARASLLTEWLDTETGIGLSFFRQPIGATDIALDYYSLAETSDDFELDRFTLEHDEEYLIPTLQEVLRLVPDATIVATPWSPPAWMRTDNSMRASAGGVLREDCYDVYARYLSAFVREYGARGIPIRYLTAQNEPLYQPNYPGMLMTAQHQARFIGGHLGPWLAHESPTTSILTLDENWSQVEYAASVLEDTAAAPYISGTAFHRYAGNASVGTRLHEQFPDKDVYLTEAATDATISLSFLVHNVIIGSLRNWAKCVVLWNLLADEWNGPYLEPGGCAICRPVTSLRDADGGWHHNDDYYAIGHVAKFVRPGATRIGSTENSYSTISNVAFENLDGTLVLLACNQGMTPHDLRVSCAGTEFSARLESGATATFVWSPLTSTPTTHS